MKRANNTSVGRTRLKVYFFPSEPHAVPVCGRQLHKSPGLAADRHIAGTAAEHRPGAKARTGLTVSLVAFLLCLQPTTKASDTNQVAPIVGSAGRTSDLPPTTETPITCQPKPASPNIPVGPHHCLTPDAAREVFHFTHEVLSNPARTVVQVFIGMTTTTNWQKRVRAWIDQALVSLPVAPSITPNKPEPNGNVRPIDSYQQTGAGRSAATQTK